MRKRIILLLLVCATSFFLVEAQTDSSKIVKNSYIPQIERTSDKTNKTDFFIISVEATADIKDAVEKTKAIRAKGHPAGYLWMPDYQSLSNKQMYAVFIGPFLDIDTTIKYLEVYKKTNPKAYAVNASHNAKRTTIMGKFDIRINNKKQFIILTYSRQEDEEQYANSGGEDWGWFVGDVNEYFRKNYSDEVIMSSVYNGWLSPSEIKELENELSLSGFGYVLINGKNKSFTPHNMSDAVIREACRFFELEYKEIENGD